MNDSHLLPRTVLRWLLVAAGALVWAWPVPAQAAGRIDPTFHPPKRLLKLDSLGGVVQGPGGEVTLSRYDGTLARLTGDGSVDTSFGGGIRTLPLPAYTSLVAVLPLAAGGVLVSTYGNYPHDTITLVALTAQGTVDQSFGENGAFTYDGLESATVIRATDGGFLIAGPLNNDGTHS